MPYDSAEGLRVSRTGTGPLPAIDRVTGPLPPIAPAPVAPAREDRPVMPPGLAAVLGSQGGVEDDGFAVELLGEVTRHARRAERLFKEAASILKAMRMAAESEGGGGVLLWEPPPVSWFDANAELAHLEEQKKHAVQAQKSQVILGSTGNLVRTIGL